MALREIIARFGFQFDQAGLKKAQNGIGGVIGSLRTFGAVIAGSVIVRGVSNFVREVVAAGDELGKTAAQLGVGVTELQRWQKAAQFSGASAQEFNTGLRTFAKNALLAQQGSKQAADAFGMLGVDIEDASGNLKENTVLMREAGLALGKIENSTERVALAQQLFGRAGTKLLPLFAKTSEELDKLLNRVDELGGGFSENAVILAEDAADAFLDLEIATDSLKSAIAEQLLPWLSASTRRFAEWLGGITKNEAAMNSLKAIVLALGIALGKAAIAKFGASLLRLGKAAILPLLKFALLFLVVDDLIALFSGRGSVIGVFIDKIFGPGSAKSIVDAIKGIGKAVSDVVKTGDFKQFDEDLEDIFAPLGFDIVSDIVFTFDMIGEALDQFGAETSEGFALISSDVVAFVKSIPGKITAGITDILVGAKELGKAIVDGIIDEILAGGKNMVKALGDTVKGAISGVKSLIESKSPSKLAAREIGKPLAEGVPMGALDAARGAARKTASALFRASALSSPRSISAPARGAGGGGGPTAATFTSTLNITVNGGSASDPQIQKLRQGVRSELRDNRRATLEALRQTVETPLI